jgi:dolichol-phosphate mannosyltransferase
MISVVVPALNERENLKSLIPEIYSRLGGYDKEVIIVDGESTDGTGELIKDFRETYSGLKYMVQSGHGYANALLEGVRAASGDFIVTMDAENHEPSNIPQMLGKLEEGFDVVVASRFIKGSKVDLQPERLLLTNVANKLSRTAMKLKVKDTSSGFRAYRSKLLKKAVTADTKTEYFSCQVEVLERISRLGGRIAEVPLHYKHRDKGESKFGLKPAVKDASKLLLIAGERELTGLKKRIKPR